MNSKLITTVLLCFGINAFADVVLKPVKRGCWVAAPLEGLWIHCADFPKYQGSNYDYLEWTFSGTAGTYELQINHIAHFSGRPKHYVSVDGKTVFGPAETPISKSGWCCADRGSPCRSTAKDNFQLVKTGVKLSLSPGAKIRFYGNVHYGCDGHGNYSGINSIILAGSGSGGGGGGGTEVPIIKVSASVIDLAYTTGGAALPQKEVSISNSGKGTLPALSATSAESWVTTKITGTGNSQTLMAQLNNKTAAAGNYTSKITLSGKDVASQVITLNLVVKGGGSSLRRQSLGFNLQSRELDTKINSLGRTQKK